MQFVRYLQLKNLLRHSSLLLFGPRQTSKTTLRVRESDLLPLRTLNAEVKLRQLIVVSQESIERTTSDGIKILPVETFFEKLWSGQFHIA